MNSKLLANLDLNQILRMVPSGLFVVDMEQNVLYWNAEAERITGFAAEEVLGKHCSFLDGIPCGKGCGLFDRDIPKPVIGATCLIRTQSGRKIHVLKNVDYLRDENGTIVGGIESFIDLNRQMRLEKALRRQSARLEKTVQRRTAELAEERAQLGALLDAMADYAYICSPDRVVRYMNRAMIKAFGDRRGETCFKVFYHLDSPCIECPMDFVVDGRTERQESYLAETGRIYEVIHSPLRTSNGSIQKLAVYRDFTERKEAEEKLREANQELDAFASIVAHDLRAPLTPILGYVEVMRDMYGERFEPQVLDMLQEIEKQGEKMLSLLEDLLLLAQVGHLAPPPVTVETQKVLQQIVQDLKKELQEAGMRVEIDAFPSLPIPATLLSQVFTNLLTNAIRYAAAPGGVVEVGSFPMGERLRIFVRDHGPGIPVEERELIFEPFSRGRRALDVRGTGIGLAIVRKIVRLYHGRVWVDTTPGGGATFWIDLPRPKRK